MPMGTRIRIRAIAPGDELGLERFYVELSADSRTARFLGATPSLGSGAAHRFCHADHDRRQGLVAEAIAADGRRRIVGHACLEPAGEAEMELAVAVADAWQHRGVGHALVHAATTWAHRHGVQRLVATAWWSNGAMLGLLRSTGYPIRFGPDDAGVVDIVLDLGEILRPAA